ncbi:MAG: magnesium-translocating P-type ATPase [Vicinamibacterales bacterium]
MTVTFFKDLFARFVRTRAISRHFQRRAILDTLRGVAVTRGLPASVAGALLAASRSAPDTLLAELHSHADGLTDSEADVIRDRVGPNEVEHEKPLRWWMHLWHCYKNPFNLLLTVLAVVSYLTGDMKATTVISLMVVLSTVMRFWQEGKSNRAADKLKEMVSNTATVLRRDLAAVVADDARNHFHATLHPKGPRRVELPIKQLVPGDLVVLSAGDMIPADCRVLSAQDLFVSQAAMTGESLPVEKFARSQDEGAVNSLELANVVFMGTNVVSGSAVAVVVHSGNRTYYGALATSVTRTEATLNQFQTGVNQVSWLLIRFMLVMAPLVLVINGVTKGDWLDASLFALSIAVGLTPEMLPMVVTSTLARGAMSLSRKKVIVKHLDAIQNFGAMDVLCTDKTGTLTQDKIVLERHTDVWGETSDAVLEYAYLNSYYQTGLKNLLDVAVRERAEIHRALDVTRAFRLVDEIPFDFERRRMSVVVAERDEQHLLICKGAVEEVLHVVSHVRHGDVDEPLTDDSVARIREVTASLNKEGLRVVAVAVKVLPPVKDNYRIPDEVELTLIGYVAFLDPPKETTTPALRALADHGVAVKVLTGDNEFVAAKVCRDVGLSVNGAVLGPDVEAMTEETLADAAERHNVFARLTPAQKERIVRALKKNGHVVGFMGDGINDAPALRAADIGISVDSGVDIAKEAADIILLEKSLMVLEEGVIEGRRTFANMLKYIRMTASSNFGNVFSVLAASAFLPFLPMLPMHLLVQNLLYDISQIAIPFDNVDDDLVRQPLRWNPAGIGRFMVYFGPISSIFDITTYGVMWFVFSANTVDEQTLFQSGWFVVGLLTQTLIVHMIRTPKVPFLQSRASTTLLIMTGFIMAIGIFLPMGPLAHYFKLEALPLAYFPILMAILLGYMTLTQAMKGVYVRRFGWE